MKKKYNIVVANGRQVTQENQIYKELKKFSQECKVYG